MFLPYLGEFLKVFYLEESQSLNSLKVMKTESKLWNIFRATHNSQQAQNWKTQYVNIG